MTAIAIIYHSRYGHTKAVAECVAEGAKKVADTVTLIEADKLDDASWQALDRADGIIFGSPTYMGSASAPMKAFIEEASSRWGKQQWKDKIAAGFTNSASYIGDKGVTMIQLYTNAMQHGMIWVSLGIPAPQFDKGEAIGNDQLNRLGGFSGLYTQANHKEGADSAPPEGDRETARQFGERVANLAKKMRTK